MSKSCSYPICMMGGSGCEKEAICDKPEQEILISQTEWVEKCKEITDLKSQLEKAEAVIKEAKSNLDYAILFLINPSPLEHEANHGYQVDAPHSIEQAIQGIEEYFKEKEGK